MNLLLISNSTNAGEAYLKYPIKKIGEFLGGVSEVIFIPFAAVTFSYDQYEEKVQDRFNEIGVKVRSIHTCEEPIKAIAQAEAICVGGGNTFALTKAMQELGLVEAIAQRVKQGAKYVGWSAGSNVTCPTLCTTNDMPIVEPISFKLMSLIPFQINPHYLDANPEGHAGETREQRILEYIAANKEIYVAGLREGCMMEYSDGKLELIGPKPMRIFKYGEQIKEVNAGDDISFLLK
ncbi:MAG: dipeptidase PepE [Rikenellaceae bacterium]